MVSKKEKSSSMQAQYELLLSIPLQANQEIVVQ